MRRTLLGLTVVLVVLAGAATGWAKTNLMVVRHSDNTIWEQTCVELSDCSGWTQVNGLLSSQPTLTWDPYLNRYILLGIGLNGQYLFRSTFNGDGSFNHDWTNLGLAPPSTPAVAGGNFNYVAGFVASNGEAWRQTANPAIDWGVWCYPGAGTCNMYQVVFFPPLFIGRIPLCTVTPTQPTPGDAANDYDTPSTWTGLAPASYVYEGYPSLIVVFKDANHNVTNCGFTFICVE